MRDPKRVAAPKMTKRGERGPQKSESCSNTYCHRDLRRALGGPRRPLLLIFCSLLQPEKKAPNTIRPAAPATRCRCRCRCLCLSSFPPSLHAQQKEIFEERTRIARARRRGASLSFVESEREAPPTPLSAFYECHLFTHHRIAPFPFHCSPCYACRCLHESDGA